MPCALTSGADYPNYLKSILKTIAAGNDNNLQACACQLRSPVNDEGCPIIDSNGKIGAFPFCFGNGVPSNPELFIKTDLETMMKVFWYREWTATSRGYLAVGCIGGNAEQVVSNKTVIFTDEDLLSCPYRPFLWVKIIEPEPWEYYIAFTNLYLNDRDFYFNFYVLAQDGWFFSAPDGSCDGYGCECGIFEVKLEGKTLGTQKMCMSASGCGDGKCHPGSLIIELNIE
jgi:hypothetical protein